MRTEPLTTFSGPFQGVSCRRTRQEGGIRAELAWNVDTSAGTLRGRPGYSIQRQFANQRILGIKGFTANDLDGTSLVAALSYDPATMATNFTVYRSGMASGAVCQVDLTSVPYGLPVDPFGYAQWLEFEGRLYFWTPRSKLHVYDYAANPDAPKVFEAEIPLNAYNMPYLHSVPKGSVVCEHLGRLWIADLDPTYWITTENTVPPEQALIPETQVRPDRKAVKYGRGFVLVSDRLSTSYWAASKWFRTSNGRKVTALASCFERLFIFTDSSVDVLEGSTDGTFRLTPLRKGVGCINARTVVQGPGFLAWLGANGFYAYDGSSVRCISDDIAEAFGEGWQAKPVAGFIALWSAAGIWPWRFARPLAFHACGVFDELGERVLWSLPSSGGDSVNRMTFVWYPSSGNWDVWACSGNSGFVPTSWTSYYDGIRQRILFANPSGDICGFGEDVTDWEPATTRVTGYRADINWGWQSPLVGSGKPAQASSRHFLVRARSVGKTTVNVPSIPRGTISDPPAGTVYLETDQAFDEPNLERTKGFYLLRSQHEAPPQEATAPGWVYGDADAKWGGVRWHQPDVWLQKYNVEPMVAPQFRAALYSWKGIERDLEIYEMGFAATEMRGLP